ncbi:hypothetical protein MBLNU459_g8444t1 [Dothideomycetes sp. NU459]
MDVAYDHIQEEALSPEEAAGRSGEPQNNLNTEFQQAFKAVSASPWGAKLGGFFGQVKKQGESLYSDAQKEYGTAAEQASKGLTDLRSSLLSHTRSLSINQSASGASTSFSDPTFALPDQQAASDAPTSSTAAPATAAGSEHAERPESLPADIVKEASSLVSRFRSEASKRLKTVQKAEDAADEALLKFGTNLKNFLRDAVTVTAPAPNKDGSSSEVMFETNDAEGKRVFHSSRFDAQLHVIHTTPASFVQDPESAEYAAFDKDFDIERQTDAIAHDLDKYEELRRAMEKLVPEKVEYALFWTRYYFLRKVIEEEERRRKEVLKGASAETEEEVAWGSDDEEGEEEDQASTPHAARSSSTLTAPKTESAELLKPAASPRRSEEDGKSTADSDASYDIVSGATSRTPGSPKEEKKAEIAAPDAVKEEESDEEDWE